MKTLIRLPFVIAAIVYVAISTSIRAANSGAKRKVK